ncbi:hypothetical protein [Bathymodiolus heckerae thiotrophic gill symbiont]|uniref:hypothetical protein n=1 Tax=Bathymodiolus heckerae thiotrophic gill symbiont TaxID=1052212 RepID=UPI0010FF079E|nr:hypothetical protein [Bathymodiolus heckerae thiotrophic gill symbiont]
MNNHQKFTFHPLGNFLNPALTLLGQGLRKSPIWQKLNFANHPYLCKGLHKNKQNWKVTPLNITIPHYQGEGVRGKNLLICFEQGFGDSIQCIRFLPLLKTQKGVKDIILVCQAPLKKLFSSITCIDHLLDENEFKKAEIHGIDHWMFIMSLPLCFNVTLETVMI